ncbi:MAG: hypothetical protein WCJ97_03895 [Phycisphaerae bacterium]
MKSLLGILALVAIIGGLSISVANACKVKPSGATSEVTAKLVQIRGKITKIDGDNITITTPASKNKDAKETIATVTANTLVRIDKVKKTKDDLKVDLYVLATLDESTIAQEINASTKAPTTRPANK